MGVREKTINLLEKSKKLDLLTKTFGALSIGEHMEASFHLCNNHTQDMHNYMFGNNEKRENEMRDIYLGDVTKTSSSPGLLKTALVAAVAASTLGTAAAFIYPMIKATPALRSPVQESPDTKLVPGLDALEFRDDTLSIEDLYR